MADYTSIDYVSDKALLFTAFCVLVLFCQITGRIVYNLFFHPLRSHPGPLLWRISSLPRDWAQLRGQYHRAILQLHEQYGEIVRVGPSELSFTAAQAFRDIYAHVPGRDEFPKHPTRITRPPNGASNILNAAKDDHARFRRLFASAFSERGMQSQRHHIEHYVRLFIDRLAERSKPSWSVDIVEWFTMVTFDIIGDLAWGDSFKCLEDRKLHEWVPAVQGSVSFSHVVGICETNGIGFVARWTLSKATRALRAANFQLAAEKVAKRKTFSTDRGDFFDHVLEKSSNGNAKGEGMSDVEMLNNATVLVLGGSETTGTLLSGATYLLCKHPTVLERVTAEVRSAFGSSAEINLFSVNKLTYMLAVLDEAMRMYPPVPVPAFRVAPRNGAQVCGSWVPGQTTVSVAQFATSRSEANFSKPNEFIPDRWLSEPPLEFRNDNRSALQPFLLGTRNCIGRNLAYAEMRLIMASLLYRFDLVLDEPRTGQWLNQNCNSLWLKPPLWIRLQQRE